MRPQGWARQEINPCQITNPNSFCTSSSAASSPISRPIEFRDPSKIDIVGIFPNYESAERAWRAKAQMTVDNAQTRYFIVHMHRFMEPMGLNRKLA